ncbi:MAG: hypothetical protein GY771_02145 [bacterium]|nr:hypothetical protein [bacterium]
MRVLTMFMIIGLTLAGGAFADVAGSYTGSGTNQNGSKYDTEVVIAKVGQTYSVQWYFDGNLGYEGVGIMKNGLLCVGYANPEGYGVVVYEVKDDGSLEGIWTGPGAEKLGSEKLAPGEYKGEGI